MIVPFVVFIEGNVKLVIERFVIVAEVSVAIVPIKLVVFVVRKLEVVAFVVEALDVMKFDCVPHKLDIVARVEFKVLINPVVKATILPVILVTVVDERVEEPVTDKFPVVVKPEVFVVVALDVEASKVVK